MDEASSAPDAAEPPRARTSRKRLLMIAAPVAALVVAVSAAGAYFGLRDNEQPLGLRDSVQQYITAITHGEFSFHLEHSAPECRAMWSEFGAEEQNQPPAEAPAAAEIPVIVALKEKDNAATVILNAPADDRNLPMYWVKIDDQWLISCPTTDIPTLEPVAPDKQISLRDTAQQALDRWSKLSSTDIDSVEALAAYFAPECRRLAESGLYAAVDSPPAPPATITSVVERGDTGTVYSSTDAGTNTAEWLQREGQWFMDCAEVLPHPS